MFERFTRLKSTPNRCLLFQTASCKRSL